MTCHHSGMDRLSLLIAWLKDRSGQYEVIAHACGLQQRWVHYLATGRIREPGWHKVEKLIRYMERDMRRERELWRV
jgi:hypothetical protein